jgi:integrase
MAEVVKFSEARVAAIRSRVKAGRVEFQDHELSALRLRVSPTGASWYVLKRIPGGAMSRVLIGKADDIVADKARKLAKIEVGKLQQGIDPNATKRKRKADAQRSGMTLAEGLAIYLAERDKLRPATKATYARDLRLTFGDYLDRPLIDLTPERVRDRHKDRKTRPIRSQAKVEHPRDRKRITASPSRADGAVRALRAVVNYLRAERDLDLPDVARKITAANGWGRVARRKRSLVGAALPEFVSAVQALGDDLPPDLTGTQRDLTLLLLCTGLRWSSAAGLRWPEIDFKASTITIPADRMKGKVEHELPLGPAMMLMLKARRAQARSKAHVFPGLQIDEKKGAKPIARLSKRFLEKIKDGDGRQINWSPHDLRRTALTILEAMDVSGYALKRIAAHSQLGDVTAGYVMDDVNRLRAPMERLEMVVLAGCAKGNVIEIERRHFA